MFLFVQLSFHISPFIFFFFFNPYPFYEQALIEHERNYILCYLKHTLCQWLFSILTHICGLFCFLLGYCGLVSFGHYHCCPQTDWSFNFFSHFQIYSWKFCELLFLLLFCYLIGFLGLFSEVMRSDMTWRCLHE